MSTDFAAQAGVDGTRLTVVSTRPAGQSVGLDASLREAGFEVVDFPLIGIAPAADPAPLDAALAGLAEYALVVFVSPNAIDQAFARLKGSWPVELPVAVVGPGSMLALARHGIAAPPYRVIGPDGAAEQAHAMEADADTSAPAPPVAGGAGAVAGTTAQSSPASSSSSTPTPTPTSTSTSSPSPSPSTAAMPPGGQAQRTAAQRVSSDNLFGDAPVDPLSGAAAAAAAAPESKISDAAVATSTDAPVDPELLRFDSETLLAALEREFGLASFRGRRVLLVRGDGGRELLADTLREHEAQVDTVAAYQRSVPIPDPGVLTTIRRLLAGRPHVWLLSSSEGVRNLETLASIHLDVSERAALHRAPVVAAHPRITESARASGFDSIVTSGAGDAALVRAVRAQAVLISASATDGRASSGPAARSGDSPAVSSTPRGASSSMTDSKDLPPQTSIPPTRFSTSGADRAAPATTPPARGRGRLVLVWLALLVAVGAVAGGLVLNRKIDRFERASTDHLQSGERIAAATQLQSQQALEGVQQTDRRISQLEGKLADAQGQQQALQTMYQDLARNRVQWTLAEIEQMLATASQQLQLTGNVQLALFALQSADTRLALAEGPQMLVVRKAIEQDIDKLKATPTVDLPGLAIKLDDAIARVDALPLAGEAPVDHPASDAAAGGWASGASAARVAPAATDAGTAPLAASTTATAGAAAASTSAANTTTSSSASSPTAAVLAPASVPASSAFARGVDRFESWWRDFGVRLGHQLAGVVQVRRIDNADAMLVAPDQAQYLRANVKLRLLSARLSLLSRDQRTMAADLDAADDALARYFDPASKSTQTVRDLVSQVRHASTSVDLPNLNASLEAVHQYKSGD
jgi:uroporphyrinogen III methyltransferase / synthase